MSTARHQYSTMKHEKTGHLLFGALFVHVCILPIYSSETVKCHMQLVRLTAERQHKNKGFHCDMSGLDQLG